MKLNLQKTAFMPIDIQKGIISSGEFTPYSSSEIISINQKLVNWFIEQESFISLVNIDVDLFKFLGPNQEVTKKESVKVPDMFTEIMLDIQEYNHTITVTKYTPGAFFNTQLDNHLRVRNIDTIVLSGLITSLGVYTTALEAYQRGYKIIVVSDACSDREMAVHEMMLEKLFNKIAIVVTSEELMKNNCI